MPAASRLTLSLLLILAASAGCSRNEPSGDPKAGKGKVWRIAVIPKGTSHDFWNNVEAGAKQADEEFADVEIVWRGPPTEGETTQQIKTVENFVIDEFDGICLAPLDANALRAPVELALKNDIPVVIFDSALDNMDGVVSYVASDNLEGGRQAGEYLAELLDGKGKVILLRYELQSESTNQREKGFMDVMRENPEIEIISENQYGGTTEDIANVKSSNLLLEFGDAVTGIFCPNESNASGMLNALRRSKPQRLGQIKFVGFDAGENLIGGLESGQLHGTVLQDPVQMGYEAVRVMRDHLLGKEAPERIPTRLHVVKYDALDDPLTVELLRPRENHSLLKQSPASKNNQHMRNWLAPLRSVAWTGALGMLRAWLGPFVGLLVVVLVFEAYHRARQPERDFIKQDRVAAIAKQTAIVGVGALGMTVIIVSGGIDLSVGSMLALTSVAFAILLRAQPPEWMSELWPSAADRWGAWPVAAAVASVLVAGVAAGALNALVITRLRLVPFIVTLGTMMVYRGVAEWLADQQKVVVNQDAIPQGLIDLMAPPGEGALLPLVCPAVWIVLALAVALALALRLTVFGRYVFAIGSNEQAAVLCGIPVKRMKVAFYSLGGFFMAVAGIFGFSEQYAQGNPTSGISLELDIIAAVVIGGGSLSGGRGSVLGSLLGALTMTTLRSGCDYAGISVSMQKIVIGAIIVAAVAIDGWLHPRK